MNHPVENDPTIEQDERYELIREVGRGVAYTTPAFAYLFRLRADRRRRPPA